MTDPNHRQWRSPDQGLLRNKKLIFGCEHFVLNLDLLEAKQTYGIKI
jgi:hypothetical protein